MKALHLLQLLFGSRQKYSGFPSMKQFPGLSHARLTLLASLIASGVLLTACGGGSTASSDPLAAYVAIASSGVSTAASADASTAPGINSLAVDHNLDTQQTGTASSTVRTIPLDGTSADKSTISGSALSADVGAGSASTTASAAAEDASAPQSKIAVARVGADSVAVGDVVIYVESTGNDANTGAVQGSAGADGPVRTISRAQVLVRGKIAAMVAGTSARVTVHVVIGPGEYPVATTMNFNTADSGTNAAPVIYEARQAGTVVITGGINLGTQVAPAATTASTYAAPADAAAVSGGTQLFINGRRAILARQPNAGEAWFVQRAIPVAGEAVGAEGSEAFAPAAANLAWINSLSAADTQRAVVNVAQAWTDGRHRLSGQATPIGGVRVSPRALWPFLSMGGISQRFYVENVAAAFDSAGEWIYDNASVHYIRRDDEIGMPLQATLPLLERLVVVQGDSAKPVQFLQFSGLTFAYTRYVTPDVGFVDGQAAYPVAAAVEVNKARNVVFDNCTFYRTGGWGIWLRDGVRNSKIVNSKFTDIGAGAIKVGLKSQAAADAGASGANEVSSNEVGNTGKVLPGAVAIWLGQTWDNQVVMNTVYNTTYTAISVGWSWGYADATSGRNLIRGNLIYNVGQRQLGDIAGIYTLGKSPGTVISYNIIRSVRGYTGYGAGAWGIYNDEGTTGIKMMNNVVLGTDHGAYHIHYGKDNTVWNNVLAGGDSAELRVTRLETSMNLQISNNLIAPKGLQPFDQYAQAPDVTFTSNEVSPTLSGPGVVIAKCGAGCSIGASPIQSTTEPIDVTSPNAGWSAVINSAIAAWKGLPSGTTTTQAIAAGTSRTFPVNLPRVADAPTAVIAPPVDFVADIGGSAAGSRPINLTYMPKGTSAIMVEAMAGAPSGKCLAFNDGATFANRWEPYAYAQLNYTAGNTVVEFDLKIDAKTVMLNEWRDNSTVYLTGPAMRITPAGVEVGGAVVAPITVDEWTKFRVSSPTGTANSKWKLEVIRANGQTTTVNNLANKNSTWAKLNWIGFVSDTAAVSKPCLATFKASNITQ